MSQRWRVHMRGQSGDGNKEWKEQIIHDVCGGGVGQRTNVRGSADETGNAFAAGHNHEPPECMWLKSVVPINKTPVKSCQDGHSVN